VTQTRPAPSQAPSAARILSGHHWLLQRASTAQGAEQAGWKPSGPGVEGKDVQLDFTSEGMLSVHNLCNQLAGRYTLDGNRILVEQLVSTMRACNNRSLMELEQRVAQRLAQLDSWQLRTAKVLPPPR
jgi:heat shock protein HslJ